jgi:hypothetical protein
MRVTAAARFAGSGLVYMRAILGLAPQALCCHSLRGLGDAAARFAGLEINVKSKLALVSLMLLASTGCIVVGGYSSGRGLWIWPGSIIIFLIGLVFFLLMLFRSRRG